MQVELTPFWILVGLGINGMVTGFSVAIGNYFANKHVIKRVERKFNNKNKPGGKKNGKQTNQRVPD